jgi:hypothetical protein
LTDADPTKGLRRGAKATHYGNPEMQEGGYG